MLKKQWIEARIQMTEDRIDILRRCITTQRETFELVNKVHKKAMFGNKDLRKLCDKTMKTLEDNATKDKQLLKDATSSYPFVVGL